VGRVTADKVGAGRTWVTREGVNVDRIASAWLIRRFIDEEARFKFVAARGYSPRTGELRFDMFEAEYTHVGEDCTFQTLQRRSVCAIVVCARSARSFTSTAGTTDSIGQKPRERRRSFRAALCSLTKTTANVWKRGAAIFDDLFEFFPKQRA
jgi:hypothetical protein